MLVAYLALTIRRPTPPLSAFPRWPFRGLRAQNPGTVFGRVFGGSYAGGGVEPHFWGYAGGGVIPLFAKKPSFSFDF